MKTSRFLLPNGFKCVGWWMLAVAVVLAVVYSVFPDGTLPQSLNDFRALVGLERMSLPANHFSGFDTESDLVLSLVGILLVVAGLFIGFSRNRQEDEFIEQLRFESLILSVYVNSLALVLAIVFVWGLSFLAVLFCSLFSVLYLFIICFYIRVFVNKRSLKNEK